MGQMLDIRMAWLFEGFNVVSVHLYLLVVEACRGKNRGIGPGGWVWELMQKHLQKTMLPSGEE